MSSRLLLLGTSLPHLVVLDALARSRVPRAGVTLLAGEATQVHPGMVPGFIAGRYRLDEIGVDLASAAATAGVELVLGRVRSLDAATRRVGLVGGTGLDYGILSVAPSDGWRAETGPAGHGVESLERLLTLVGALDTLASNPRPEPRRLVILGASELGVELALATRARLDGRGASDVIISILESRSELFGGRLPAWAERVERLLAERDIILRLGTGAVEVGTDFVRLNDGRVQPADVVVTAPGPVAWSPLRSSGLPVDAHGFLQLDDTLQAPGVAAVFGAGSSTTLMASPRTTFPVAAQVRMGRVLARNLAQVMEGRPATHRFHLRDRELTLLDAGDGRAVFLGGPVAVVSRWALRFKQREDRRLVARLRRSGQTGTRRSGDS